MNHPAEMVGQVAPPYEEPTGLGSILAALHAGLPPENHLALGYLPLPDGALEAVIEWLVDRGHITPRPEGGYIVHAVDPAAWPAIYGALACAAETNPALAHLARYAPNEGRRLMEILNTDTYRQAVRDEAPVRLTRPQGEVFTCLGKSRQPMSAEQICMALKIAPATAQRILAALNRESLAASRSGPDGLRLWALTRRGAGAFGENYYAIGR